MAKIRIPEAKVPQFKAFCKRFSTHFENQTGTRLRGNVLLNLVARAAGHQSYTALLIDAKTYGTGKFSWDLLPASLYRQVADSTNTSPAACLHSLSSALLDDHEILGDLSSKVGNSVNPFSNVLPAITLSTPQPDHWKKVSSEYGRIFESDSAEVEINDIFEKNENPVIDLNVLHSPGLSDSDKSALCKLLVTQYMDLSEDVRRNVVFLGEKKDVTQLLEVGVESALALFQNPSIRLKGAQTFFASSDVADLEKVSDAEAEAIFSNANIKLILSDKNDLSLGERFAQRKRPTEMQNIEKAIISALDAAKLEVAEIIPGSFDLRSLANSIYIKLPSTNGFSSLDLAGWLLDNNRRVGVSVCNLPEAIDKLNDQ